MLLIAAMAAPAFAGERLCPVPAKLPADQDDLRITEDQFTVKEYRESLDYLPSELPRRLRALPSGSDVDTIEGFWISYFNSLTFIEGYTLKTSALLERARHGGKAGGPAEQRFCAWLQKQEYVD